MDLNSINQNVLRLINNSSKIISFLPEYAVDGAKDVSITYENADGTESTKTYPNIAKQVSQISSAVPNAMSKTFYVDTVNGSDSNDGSSNHPFASIQKAIDSTPISGFANINIVSDYTGTFSSSFKTIKITISSGKTWTIPKNNVCGISGSNVSILNQGTLIIDRGDGSGINGDNYAGFFANDYELNNTLGVATNLYLVNDGDTNPITIDKDRALFGSRTVGTNQNIQMNLSVYNLYCKGNFTIDGSLMRLQHGAGSFQWNNSGNDSSFAIVDSGGNSVDVATKILGIIKDTNGVPRNIMSNLVL